MTAAPAQVAYREGYYEGMKDALRIVRQCQPAPQTNCSERGFAAARTRIAAYLAGAVARNEPEDYR